MTFEKAIHERKNWDIGNLGKQCKNADACSKPGVYNFIFDASRPAESDSSDSTDLSDSLTETTVTPTLNDRTYLMMFGLYVDSTIAMIISRWLRYDEILSNKNADMQLVHTAAKHFQQPLRAAAVLDASSLCPKIETDDDIQTLRATIRLCETAIQTFFG